MGREAEYEKRGVEDLHQESQKLIKRLTILAFHLAKNGKEAKAEMIIKRIQNLIRAVYDSPSESGRLTDELRTAIVLDWISMRRNKDPNGRQSERFRLFHLYKCCPYSSIVYLLMELIDCLNNYNHETFYNKANSLNDLICRSIHKKFNSPLEDIRISQAISMKYIDSDICSTELYKCIVCIGMMMYCICMKLDNPTNEKISSISNNSLIIAEGLGGHGFAEVMNQLKRNVELSLKTRGQGKEATAETSHKELGRDGTLSRSAKKTHLIRTTPNKSQKSMDGTAQDKISIVVNRADAGVGSMSKKSLRIGAGAVNISSFVDGLPFSSRRNSVSFSPSPSVTGRHIKHKSESIHQQEDRGFVVVNNKLIPKLSENVSRLLANIR